jgi:hypothetical protein
MLERTDAITNEVLEPVTLVLVYSTVCHFVTTEDSLILHRHRQLPHLGEVLGYKSTMYIKTTVLSHFLNIFLVLFCIIVYMVVC